MHRSNAPHDQMPPDGAVMAGWPTSGYMEVDKIGIVAEEKCAAVPPKMQPRQSGRTEERHQAGRRHVDEPGFVEETWNWYLAFSLEGAGQTIDVGSIRSRVLLVGSDGAQPALLGKFVTVLPGNAGGERSRAASDPPIPGLSEATREMLGCIIASLPRVRGILVVDSLEQDSLGAQTDALADGSRPVYVIVTSSKFKDGPKTNAQGECADAPVPDRLCVTPAFSTPMNPDPSDVGRRLAKLLEKPVGNASGLAKPEYEVFPGPKDPSERVELCPSGLKVEEID